MDDDFGAQDEDGMDFFDRYLVDNEVSTLFPCEGSLAVRGKRRG